MTSPPKRTWPLHLGLFLATCASTTLAGGPEFAAALMLILLTHEMGHFVLAKHHRVDVSLPYFIPLPLGIGTMGAVIRMRGAIKSRDALVDIGAAGPLAGLAVAIPVLIYGLSLSKVGPVVPGGMLEGNSLLYLGLKLIVKGAVLPSAGPGGGRDVFLHPIAFAGWIGLLVTMINLLPIGQLDGGHIAYGFFGQRHDRASAVLHALLVPVGAAVFLYVGSQVGFRGAGAGEALQAALPWFVWPLMIGVLRRISGGAWHPPVGNDPLSPGRRALCIVVAALFLLIFVPIPFRASP